MSYVEPSFQDLINFVNSITLIHDKNQKNGVGTPEFTEAVEKIKSRLQEGSSDDTHKIFFDIVREIDGCRDREEYHQTYYFLRVEFFKHFNADLEGVLASE